MTSLESDRILDVAQRGSFMARSIKPESLQAAMSEKLQAVDFVLKLSGGVGSLTLICFCRSKGALYLDTSIEPWRGKFFDRSLSLAACTNFGQREAALQLRDAANKGPTAVQIHGANPGLLSHFFKQALLNIAQDRNQPIERHGSLAAWAQFGAVLQVQIVHIAEHNARSGSYQRHPGEFVNSWPVEAFVKDANRPSELVWESQEQQSAADGRRHETDSGADIYLECPGASTWVRSWTPLGGPMHGRSITQAKSISVADYFFLKQGEQIIYHPTVCYVFHPSDAALLPLQELPGHNCRLTRGADVLKMEIDQSKDALGIQVMSHGRKPYWYASQLSISQARPARPHNSATSLQVTAAVMAGVEWSIRTPSCGVYEPDELPSDVILGLFLPYQGNVQGYYTNWTPLQGCDHHYSEDMDSSSPWQFKNFRIFETVVCSLT